MDLPRELRDEIFQLAVQDDVDPRRDADLASRPGPTIKVLTQVSRSVRVEAADIYWSRANYNYSAHDLLRDETLDDYRSRYKLTSWLSTWGRLAVPQIRRLKLDLSIHSGGIDIQLSRPASPSFTAWTHNDSRAEDYLKVIVTAELFPNRHSTLTPERLEKVCGTLREVGCMIPPPERRTSKLFLGGLAWHTSDETLRNIVAEPSSC
jgi:hypothetical protein